MKKINELIGLRAILAWWVVVAHVFLAAGYDVNNYSGWLRLLQRGEYAVDVFIIISGFVIFLLIDKSRQGYSVFIVQRFFRLFPVYFVFLCLGFLDYEIWGGLIEMRPWEWGQAEYLDFENWQLMGEHFYAHFLVHLTMFHGLVPDSILPRSAVAIIGPAWSISLEWQFYLMAPFVYFLLKSFNHFRWLVVCLVVVVAYWIIGPMVDASLAQKSFIAQKAFHFWIGIVSYFIFRELEDKAGVAQKIGVLLSFGLAPCLFFLTLSIPLMIWCFVLGIMILSWHGSWGVISRVASFLLSNRVMLRLGDISYSTYLVHFFCIHGVQFVLFKFGLVSDQLETLYFSMPLVFILTYFCSELTYRYIELPGIRLGRNITHSKRSIK